MSVPRRIAAVVVPDALKRTHERWVTGRYLAAVRPATRHYVRRHGLVVRRGPFTGLRYLEAAQGAWSEDLVSKLVGAYEQELHPAVQEWIAAGHRTVIDVGSAEGFYAVGFATAMPEATVHAYDVDPVAREQTAALATLNGVADRVVVGGRCTPETLSGFPPDGVALLADCEGCERTLLDPDAAAVLRGWPIIVELHEFLDPGIADALRERFGTTHDIELVPGSPRAPEAVPELGFLSRRAASRVLDERRPARMRWAVLRPRDRP